MQDFETIVSSAARGGWDWFNQITDPATRKKLDVEQARNEEEAKAISRAWADFAASPEGRKALDRLFDTTLRRTVWFVNLSGDMQAMAAFGCFREGQNALAQEIARQIAIGRGEAAKPRDT